MSAPVSTLMRHTLKVESIDSLALAATRYGQNGASILPVTRDDRLVGVITDQALVKALGAGVETTDAVEGWMLPPETIFNNETGAEALRRIENGTSLVVVDADRRVLGILSGCDLWPRRRPKPRPALVGGMATPFGVYLTNGAVTGGAPRWALVATGAAMFSMLYTAETVVMLTGDWLTKRHVPADLLDTGLPIATIVLF